MKHPIINTRTLPWAVAGICFTLAVMASKDCRAQVNDKALHAGASAGIGLVLRNTMDSKHDAFALTLAAGVAKEMADRARNPSFIRQQAVNKALEQA